MKIFKLFFYFRNIIIFPRISISRGKYFIGGICKMKFKICEKKEMRALIVITSYIIAVSLIFWGIYSIMKSSQALGEGGTADAGTGSLGVFSELYYGSSLIPGRESIRAVWIATVSNINYPTKRGLAKKELCEELDRIVERCASLGANAIFFQVRPCSDALYDSDIFPSSHYVSGERGKDADGGFDSLEYLIKAAKKANIDVHAWVNPVRVLPGSAKDPALHSELTSDEPAARHPEWTVSYADGKLYYNLGLPEVRTLIADGVYEIVQKYDVAGVVFDDYFYPYPVYASNGALAEFDDSAAYEKYGGGATLADFRRANVNALVRQCSGAVSRADNSCLFGVSPFGVWKNSEAAGGSGTSGLESYSAIYCDTLAFAREGTVDYIAPQLYWSIDDASYGYASLVEWWNKALSGTNTLLVPCLAPYRYSDGDYKKGELTAQLKHARTLSLYAGCALYGYAALTDASLSVSDEVKALWK